MAVVLDGTTGVSLVQDGAITDANLPAGSVIQVVQSDTSTPYSNTGASYSHTNLTGSITPSSTSSKILVLVDSVGRMYRNAGAGSTVSILLYKDGSAVSDTERRYNGYDNGDAWYDAFLVGIKYLDSPSTTSSVEYKLYAKNTAATFNPEVQFQQDSHKSTITLMEIAG